MQRVRREIPGSPGAVGRLAWAVGLSTVLHVAAIVGIGAQLSGKPHSQVSVIAARLVPLAPEVVPPARPVTAIEAAEIEAAEMEAIAPEPVPVIEASRDELISSEEAPAQAAPAPEAKVEVAALDDVPDATHYPAKDLDVFPRLKAELRPVWPVLAIEERIPGHVTLLVLIDERGRVLDASVVDAIPAGLLEEAARDALLQAAFTPAERAGRTVRSRILVNLQFDPERAAR